MTISAIPSHTHTHTPSASYTGSFQGSVSCPFLEDSQSLPQQIKEKDNKA